MATSKLIPDDDYLKKADDPQFALAFARIECHYFINHIFLEDSVILRNMGKIEHIPGVIAQESYDVVCPVTSSSEPHQARHKSELLIFQAAGHSMSEV